MLTVVVLPADSTHEFDIRRGHHICASGFDLSHLSGLKSFAISLADRQSYDVAGESDNRGECEEASWKLHRRRW